MKKFFQKLKSLISRHKLLFAICFLAFIVILIMIYIFFSLFIGGTDKYGDRLKGIEEHEISSSEKKEVVTFLEEKEEVSHANVRVQGKIIYVYIIFKKEVSLDRAKEIANESLNKFDDEDKSFYDFGYSLTQAVGEEDAEKGFVVTGTKNAKLDSISWIKS